MSDLGVDVLRTDPTPVPPRSAPPPAPSPRARAHLRRTVAWMVLAGLVGVAVAAPLAWRISGGRWLEVATPSMGRAAPVGTLVLERPVLVARIHVGDIITFHPPTIAKETFTHRVIAIDPGGAVHTRGDINGSTDPWALRQHDITGRVVARWWGVGWLLRTLPLLMLGSVLIWATTARYASERCRGPVRLFAVAALVSMVGFLLKPFVRLAVISTKADATTAHAAVVSTGILPTRISVTGGTHADLRDGHVAVLSTHHVDPSGRYGLQAALHMPVSWWVVVTLVCASPILWCLIIGFAPLGDVPPTGDPPTSPPPPADDTVVPIGRRAVGRAGFPVARTPQRRPPSSSAVGTMARRTVLGGVVIAALGMLVAFSTTTQSAFAATVRNSADIATAAPYFTCKAAAVGNSAFFAYPLNDATGTAGASAADVSGNARSGTYQGPVSSVANPGCVRDGAASAVFNGTSTYVSTPTMVTNPQVFTEEIWFKTTATTGGDLMGWGTSQTGLPTQYDRELFMTNAGTLVFGVYSGGANKEVISPKTYNDGAWHHAAATLSASGMVLYLDGAAVATDPATTSAQVDNGYWRIGWTNINGWPNVPTSYYFTGRLAFAAYYASALTASQVATHYIAGH